MSTVRLCCWFNPEITPTVCSVTYKYQTSQFPGLGVTFYTKNRLIGRSIYSSIFLKNEDISPTWHSFLIWSWNRFFAGAEETWSLLKKSNLGWFLNRFQLLQGGPSPPLSLKDASYQIFTAAAVHWQSQTVNSSMFLVEVDYEDCKVYSNVIWEARINKTA